MADISQITLPDGTTYDIKDPVARAAASEAGVGGIFYGTCDTASATQTKVVNIEDFELFTGVMIAIKFDNVNTATSPKININGGGAKNLYSVGTTAVLPYAWKAGEVVMFTYNGTAFVMVEGGIASTTEYGVTKLNSSTSSTSTIEAATPSAVKQAYDLAATANNNIPDVSGKLDKSGGTMTGPLVLASDPTVALQAATKQYVDTVVDDSVINPSKYYWKRRNVTFTSPPALSSYTYITSNQNYLYIGTAYYTNNVLNNVVMVYDVASSVSIDSSTGEVVLDNPTRVTINGYSDDDISAFTASGVYVKLVSYTKHNSEYYPSGTSALKCSDIYNNPNRIWYFDAAPTFTASMSSYDGHRLGYWRVGTYSYVRYCDLSEGFTYYNNYITSNEITVSDNVSDTYPQDSTFNIYSDCLPYAYKYLGSGSDLLKPPVNIETGSYTGTGTKGSGAPNSLTFSGVPVFVWICSNDSTFMSMFNVVNLTSSFKSYGIVFQSGNYLGQSSSNQAKIVGNTLSWYYSSDARWQLNESGVTYNWFAITV